MCNSASIIQYFKHYNTFYTMYNIVSNNKLYYIVNNLKYFKQRETL